jgi:hypothetical protein
MKPSRRHALASPRTRSLVLPPFPSANSRPLSSVSGEREPAQWNECHSPTLGEVRIGFAVVGVMARVEVHVRFGVIHWFFEVIGVVHPYEVMDHILRALSKWCVEIRAVPSTEAPSRQLMYRISFVWDRSPSPTPIGPRTLEPIPISTFSRMRWAFCAASRYASGVSTQTFPGPPGLNRSSKGRIQ